MNYLFKNNLFTLTLTFFFLSHSANAIFTPNDKQVGVNVTKSVIFSNDFNGPALIHIEDEDGSTIATLNELPSDRNIELTFPPIPGADVIFTVNHNNDCMTFSFSLNRLQDGMQLNITQGDNFEYDRDEHYADRLPIDDFSYDDDDSTESN